MSIGKWKGDWIIGGNYWKWMDNWKWKNIHKLKLLMEYMEGWWRFVISEMRGRTSSNWELELWYMNMDIHYGNTEWREKQKMFHWLSLQRMSPRIRVGKCSFVEWMHVNRSWTKYCMVTCVGYTDTVAMHISHLSMWAFNVKVFTFRSNTFKHSYPILQPLRDFLPTVRYCSKDNFSRDSRLERTNRPRIVYLIPPETLSKLTVSNPSRTSKGIFVIPPCFHSSIVTSPSLS